MNLFIVLGNVLGLPCPSSLLFSFLRLVLIVDVAYDSIHGVDYGAKRGGPKSGPPGVLNLPLGLNE